MGRKMTIGAIAVGAAGLLAAIGIGTSQIVSGTDTTTTTVVRNLSSATTFISPGQSWSAAYQAASPGDVIQLAAGTYSGQTILDASKTGTPVTFQGGPGVVMNGDLTLGQDAGCNGADHIVFRDIKINGAFTTRCGSTDLTFESITAKNMNLGGGNGLTVIRSSIGPNVDDNSEIKNGARNVLIESSIFHDSLISNAANHDECIQIWGAGVGDAANGVPGVLIHNTIFRNCTDFDVLVKASNSYAISFQNSFFDNPMPGNEATTLCNPNCPRGGSSVRYSTYAYPNSFFTNNMNNGGLSIDVAGNVTVSGNYQGTLPLVPPGTPPPTTTTTTTVPTTTTEPTTTTTEPTTTTETTTSTTTTEPTTTTAPPPAGLQLHLVSETQSTITLGWTAPSTAVGYRFSREGYTKADGSPRYSVTWDGGTAEVKFAKGSAWYRVEALGLLDTDEYRP